MRAIFTDLMAGRVIWIGGLFSQGKGVLCLFARRRSGACQIAAPSRRLPQKGQWRRATRASLHFNNVLSLVQAAFGWPKPQASAARYQDQAWT